MLVTDSWNMNKSLSRYSPWRTSIAMIGSALALATAAHAQPSDLEEVVNRYNAVHEKIGADYSKAIHSAIERYGRSVDAMAKQAQSQGDLETVLALMAEAKRVDAEKTVPDSDSSHLNPMLAKLREGYQLAVQTAEDRRATALPALQDSYVKKLDAMKRQLTIEGKLEEALAVKAEMERVESGLNTATGMGVNVDAEPYESSADVSSPAYDPFLDERETTSVSPSVVRGVASVEPSARQKFLDRQNQIKNARPSTTRQHGSESLGEGISQYREVIPSMAEQFKRGESKAVKLSVVKNDPSAFKGQVLRSGVYVVSAFARGVTVSATSGGKDTVEFVPYTMEIGKDAEKIFTEIGAGGMAVVIYGVVNEDNLTLFGLDPL